MSPRETLTNEKLKARFDNLFGLVTYAIDIAKSKIAKGEGTDGNVAEEVLEEIEEGRDTFEEISEEEEEEQEEKW